MIRFVAFAAVVLAACYDPGDGPSFAMNEDGGPGAAASSAPGSTPGASTPGATPAANDPDGGAPGATCTHSAKTYGTMHMWECVPAGMEGKTGQPAGLVVAMHGYTQGVFTPSTPWGFEPTSQWQVLAQKHHFYVIYPDKGTQAFQWYAFFNTSGIGRSDLEPSSIAEMVADMKAKHDIDPNKVFANGLSAGAYMTTVMLATYPDVFAGGSMFEGGAYGCSTSCAALGKKGQGWTWPGDHPASLVTGAYPQVWQSASARKPKLLVFQGDADGAVTPENMTDVVQQWKGALGLTDPGTKSTLKGHAYTEYKQGSEVMLASLSMSGIGHGTPVDPGPGEDQGGWDPQPSKTASSDANATQDWTNTAGIWGPYYSAKFWGLIP
jgi:poly(hydroxyalkanoate) depolymerase family esterase